jgi:hypothetical protein
VRTGSHMGTFELDLYFASGSPANAEVEDHLAGCARCRSYLAALERLGSVSSPPEPVEGAPSAPVVQPAVWRLWPVASAFGAALALAAVMVLLVRGRRVPVDYVATKGTPAVQVLVRRGVDTWVWDGRSPIFAGDALAIEVACEGLDHITVAVPGVGGWARIKELGCPARHAPLPFTLVADDAPGDESFAVVLSHNALSDSDLRESVAESRRSGDIWVGVFVLPRKVARDR